MDRPLDPKTLKQRRLRRILQAGGAAAGAVAVFLLLSALMKPSLDRTEIRTAIVQRGTIVGSISATGTVVPRFEQAISSPCETRLLAVRRRPGDIVKKGEALLELDRSESALALEKTERELDLKANQQAQVRLDMDRALSDLDGQLKINDLRLQFLRSKTAQSEKMFKIGAVSKDQLDQAKLEEQIATIERQDLEGSIASTKHSLENQLEGMTTEVRTLLKEKADNRHQLDLLECMAGQNGVVTWVKDQIGTSVHSGEVIARVADLSSYRVEASLSDIHASILAAGMPALVRLNDTTIPAHVETVYPTIENGIAKIGLSLDDPANRLLRPSLRVDVSLVTAKRDSTLTVAKGPFITGEGLQDVFVIRGSSARRVAVQIGLIGFDKVEIVRGVSAGDEVIVSDMKEYQQLSQISVH